MNEVSTKLTKINFKWLIEHCTDKENWKRSWTIYDYDKFKCVIKLREIDIKNDSLYLDVIGSGNWNSNAICIPMNKDNYNEDVFLKKLYSCIYNRISYFEADKIMNSEQYKQAKLKDGELLEEFKNKLNEYLNDLGIDDSEIREAFIDKKIDEFNSDKYAIEILSTFQETIFTSHYAMLALQFDRQKDYQRLIQLSEVDEEVLKEKFNEIEYEYQEDMNNLLEG